MTSTASPIRLSIIPRGFDVLLEGEYPARPFTHRKNETFLRKCAFFTRLLNNRRRSRKTDERGREAARETSGGAKAAPRSLCLLLERRRRYCRCGVLCI